MTLTFWGLGGGCKRVGAGRKREPAWTGTAGRNTAQAEWTKREKSSL